MNIPKSKTNIKKLAHNSSSDTDDNMAVAAADIKNNKCKIEGMTKLTAADVKKRTRLQPRRTKLDAFVCKRPPPSSNNNDKNRNSSYNDESDFETPEKKRMQQTAPTLKPTHQESRLQRAQKRKPSEKSRRRERKQPNIKSALLRNEMLFSDIVAQHTIADNFSPDEMQLALALSKSEAELRHTPNYQEPQAKDDKETTDEAQEEKVENIREQLKRYGFRTGTRADYENLATDFGTSENSKRQRKYKWAHKITPLTLRNAEVQTKKLQQNIDKVLRSAKTSDKISADDKNITVYTPVSSMLKELLESSLPAITTKDDNSMTMNSSQQLESYFVESLFEVSHLRAGYLLKDWSSIPGREVSPNSKERIQILKERSTRTVKEKNDEKVNEAEPVYEKNQATINEDVKKITDSSVLNMELQLLSQIAACSPTTDTAQIEVDMDKNESNNSSLHDSLTDLRVHSPDIFANSLCESPVHALAAANNTCENNEENDERKHETSTGITENILAYETDSRGDEHISRENVDAPLVTITQSTDLQEIRERKEKEENSENNVTPCILDLTQSDEEDSGTTVEKEDQQPPLQVFSEEHDKQNSQNNVAPYSLELTHCDTENYGMHVEEEEVDQLQLLQVSSEEHDKEEENSQNMAPYILDLTQSDVEDSRISVDEEVELLQLSSEEHDKEEDNPQPTTTPPGFFDLSQCDAEDSDIYELSSNEVENDVEEEEQRKGSATTVEKNDSKEEEEEEKVVLMSPKNKRPRLTSSLLNSLNVSYNRKSTSLGDLKCNSTSAATESIDITQNINNSENNTNDDDYNNDGDDDDDVILLSDDEINYSTIKSKSFKINHTAILNNQTQAQAIIDNNIIDNNTSDESDGDDDAILLSDDEINYSTIKSKSFKINHTAILNNQTKAQAIIDNNTSDESEVDFDEVQVMNEEEEEKDGVNNNNNYSVLDLLADFRACEKSEEKNEDKEKQNKNSSILNDSLEEALAVAAALEDDSYFMSKSTTESTAPMKRFSIGQNNEKFTNLLSNILDNENNDKKQKNDDHNDMADFDEFDALVYQANNIETLPNQNPIGLEQLLTAEIRTNPLKDITSQEIRTVGKPIEKSLTESSIPPPCQEVNVNGITYLVRESHTPEPIYEEWSDEELHNKLDEYGIKPLKRYQAIKMLNYIYRSTHPIVIDDDDDKAEEINMPNTKPKNTLTNLEVKHCYNENENNKDMLCLSDNCGGEILLKNFNTSWDTLLEGEEYIFQTNITKKTQQPLLPFHKAWSNLVASNTTLHERLLMYEPIDLECIYRYLKNINYRYDPKHIREFFDKRCIIFSYESPTLKQPDGLQKPCVGRQKTSNKLTTKKRMQNL